MAALFMSMNGRENTMFRLIVLLVLFMGSINSSSAKLIYCTGKNWETATGSYRKNENKYNNYSKKYNELLKTHDNVEFVSQRYDVKEFSKVWTLNNSVLATNVEAMHAFSRQESKKIEKVVKKIKTLKTRFVKTKEIWSELAEYCYDEDIYKDYKGARKNMRAAIKANTDSDRLIGKLRKIQDDYTRDIKFINAAKKVFEENCGCSVE
jgi:hypothetical protein